MTRRNTSITSTLWAFSNLCNIFMKIFIRRETEAERYSLNAWRKAKIAQDIRISRTREDALKVTTGIHVRRWESQNASDNNKVMLQDLNIEVQKLKIMELRRKLGLTDEEFRALGYDINDYADSAGLPHPESRR